MGGSARAHAGRRVVTNALLAVALLLGGITACADEPAPAPEQPLRVSDNGRYLVDESGTPWLMAADTAWTIVSKLTPAEADQYLDGRSASGFNSVAISLVDITSGSVRATTDAAGEPLFRPGTDEPNPAFFESIDRFLDAAESRGITVLIVPMWLKFADQDPGFTVDAMTNLGTFLGERYRDRDNIIWVMGGDYGSAEGEGLCPRPDEVRALANAIDRSDPRHLITYHPGANLSSTTCYPDEPWLDFDSTYWDFNTDNLSSAYRNVWRDYDSDPVRPVVMLEAGYEGPHPGDPDPDVLDARTSRLQSYEMMLAGGLGFTYGANSTYFTDNDSPVAARTWQESLTIPGAQQQGLAARLLRDHAWWRLAPDRDAAVVVGGQGTVGEQDYVVTALADDGSLAISYLPTARPIVVDLDRLRGPVTARWYDPTSGRYLPALDGDTPATGRRELTPPAANEAGDDDWILVLEA